MIRRMYDTPFEAQQNQAKRLKMLAMILVLAVVLAGILSWPRPIFDPQAMREYIHLPTLARPNEPFCVTIEGLGDPEVATGLLPESIVRWSEFWSDLRSIGSSWLDNQGYVTVSKTIPGQAQWCDPYGLDEGPHLMHFYLRDSRGQLASYEWFLDVQS